MTTAETQLALPELQSTFDEVLMPVDFSSLGWRVLPLAERLARTFRSPLRLVHVDTASPWSETDTAALWLRATPFRRQVQVEVVADLDEASGLMRMIADRDVLVCMATHGHTGAAEMLAGSTTERLLRSFDGPVVLAGPRFNTGHVPLTRIVTCLDPGEPPAPLLADVTTWAKRLHVAVELVTVLPRRGQEPLDETRQYETRLERLAARLEQSGIATSAVVLRGSLPGHELVDYIDDVPGTLAALATHARTAAARALIGSVGMKVVRRSQNPVLLRRRDG